MTDAPLVGAITLIRTLPCLADPGKLIVIGETDAAIDGVLPLLNAILPTVVSYHPFTGVMTLRRRPGLITLYPSQVMITQVADVEEGLALLAAMRDLINRTWARRDEIQPRHEGRRVRGRWMCTSCCRAPTVGPAARRPAWRLRSACWRAAIGRRSAPRWPIRPSPRSARRWPICCRIRLRPLAGRT